LSLQAHPETGRDLANLNSIRPGPGSNRKEHDMNKILLTLLVLQGSVADKIKNRRDAGQGSLEYVAMIGVAVMIIVAIVSVATPAGTAMGAIITAAVDKVKSAVGL
jgi:hypothetical protein